MRIYFFRCCLQQILATCACRQQQITATINKQILLATALLPAAAGRSRCGAYARVFLCRPAPAPTLSMSCRCATLILFAHITDMISFIIYRLRRVFGRHVRTLSTIIMDTQSLWHKLWQIFHLILAHKQIVYATCCLPHNAAWKISAKLSRKNTTKCKKCILLHATAFICAYLCS